MPTESRMSILDDECLMTRKSGKIPIESELSAPPWGLIPGAYPRCGRGISIGLDAAIKAGGRAA